jgi:ATP-binding cassette subfamily B protein
MISTRTRRIFKRVLVAVVVLFAATITLAITSPAAARPLLALAIGGTYEGADGVRFQKTSTDCGVSSLEMIFIGHGLPTDSLEPVRDMAAHRDSGLTMLEMRDIAVVHGLTAEGMRMNLPALAQTRLPAIASFPEHWVVVDRVTPETVEIRDPSIGRVKLTHERFLELWTGHILVIGKGT